MDSIFDWAERVLFPWTENFAKNKYIIVLRNTFFTMVPFWLVLALFSVVQGILLDPTGPLMGENGFGLGAYFTDGLYGQDYLDSDFARTLGLFSRAMNMSSDIAYIFVTLTLSVNLAHLWGVNATLAALCSLGGLFILAFDPAAGSAHGGIFIAHSAVMSMLAAIFAPRLLSRLSRFSSLRLPVPETMPYELTKTIGMFVPAGITLLIFGFINLFRILLVNHFSAEIDTFISVWLMPASQRLVFAVIYQLVIWALWWCGLNGHNIGWVVTSETYIPAGIANHSGGSEYIFTVGFFVSGIHHVLALAIALFVFSKNEAWRKVAKFCFLPLLFNVQAPLIFGLPVVLNPIFLVPYILAPVANTIVSWAAMSWDIVPVFRFLVPWTTPTFFHGTIGASSMMGGVLEIVTLIFDVFIYAPFVIASNRFDDVRAEKRRSP